MSANPVHLPATKMREVHLFSDARGTMRRCSDMSVTTGWMLEITSCSASIRVDEMPEDIQTNERFVLEARQGEKSATLLGEVSAIKGKVVHFNVVGGRQHVRVGVRGYAGRIAVGRDLVPFTSMDISAAGMGALSTSALTPGAIGDAELDSPVGVIRFRAEVRYCTRDSGPAEQFRIGLLIAEIGRADQVRWQRFLVDAWPQ